jgi:hypothetical protein
MGKIISTGYTDTAYTGTPVLTRGKLNFTSDFRVGQTKADQIVLVNLTSPNDRIEKATIAFSNIKDIYQNTEIDPSVYAPSRRGINLYVQLKDTYSVTDDVDADFEQHLPISVSMTIRVPASQFLTAEHVQTVLARAVSLLYDQNSIAVTRLNSLLKGSLTPTEL